MRRREVAAVLGGLAWLFGVGYGMALLWAYASTPGAAGQPPDRWPSASRISPRPGTATLVMLAHPRCPCTRSSLEELGHIMARCQGRVEAHVLFLRPAGVPDDWAMTDLWRSAAAIPGVSAELDEGGAESRNFNAVTSGQTILYDGAGRLVFSGGITESRGHEGDNPGRDAIVSLLTTGTAGRAETYVFGCSLLDPGPPSGSSGG